METAGKYGKMTNTSLEEHISVDKECVANCVSA